MKQIVIDVAKSVYQVAESVHAGRVDRRRRLDPEALCRYVQEQSQPVEGGRLWPGGGTGEQDGEDLLGGVVPRRRFSGDWQSARPA